MNEETVAKQFRNAAARGDIEELRRLLDEGVNVDVQEDYNSRPVVAAARRGQREAVSFLLDQGANPHSYPGETNSLIHEVARQGWVDIARRLIQAGVSADVRDHDGEAVIHAAVSVSVRRDEEHLHGQKDQNCAAVVRLLLSQDVDPNSTCEYTYATPLHRAASCSAGHCLRELLSAGANIYGNVAEAITSIRVTTPLYFAVRAIFVDGVRMLLEAGAKPDFPAEGNTRTPLMCAMQSFGYYWPQYVHIVTEMVDLLLQYGADPLASDKDKRTVLHHAAWYAPIPLLQELLQRGALVNALDYRGFIPLHVAAGSGREECVSLMLDAGADPNATAYEGATPLYMAVYWNRLAVAERLVRHGARADIPAPQRGKPNGKPMLRWAIENDNTRLCELLLQADADPNAPNFVGQTCLHYATNLGKKEIIRILLAGGADPTRRDHNGQTPLDLARARKRKAVIALLEAVS